MKFREEIDVTNYLESYRLQFELNYFLDFLEMKENRNYTEICYLRGLLRKAGKLVWKVQFVFFFL